MLFRYVIFFLQVTYIKHFLEFLLWIQSDLCLQKGPPFAHHHHSPFYSQIHFCSHWPGVISSLLPYIIYARKAESQAEIVDSGSDSEIHVQAKSRQNKPTKNFLSMKAVNTQLT